MSNNTEKVQKKLPDFDADLSPGNEYNQRAAAKRRLTFDFRSGVCRDTDGCPVLDKFGQPLG